MRTKSSLEFSLAGKAIQNTTQFKRGFIHISSHIINILFLSQLAWQISKADTNVKQEEKGGLNEIL